MTATQHETVATVDDDADAHPSRERTYVIVALALFGLTVVEVLTYAIPDAFGGKESVTLIVALLALMAIKFWTVAWFFMHLKFDSRLLTIVFYSGLVLAVLVYLAVLTAFRFFSTQHMVAG